MRRAVLVLVLVTAALLVGVSGSARSGTSHSPAGWHVVRQRWTRVVEPIPWLAMANFKVELNRRSCPCDWPSVRNLPRGGAFLFVWEYTRVSSIGWRAFPDRPRHFRIPATYTPWVPSNCSPSYGTAFRKGRRGFQAEVYLGPVAGAEVRAGIAAILDNLRVSSPPVSGAVPPA
ncbi:MAG: hypothetical protein WCB67_16290 [Solirubrobacteraceae bacterium]